MSTRLTRFLMGAALVLAVAPQLEAQEQALRITAANRTAAAEAQAGTPRRDPNARPGDVLRYTLTFSNTTGRVVRGVVMSDPIPPGFQFVAGSSSASRADARVEYSIDGGETFSAQPMVMVEENGRRVQRPAAPVQYTNVRWVVGGEVAPGATVTAEFDARIGVSSRRQGTAVAPAAN